MKLELTHDLVFANLDRIIAEKEECLHKNEFVNVNGGRLLDSSSLIAYLLKHDLIEVEDDPNIYFLTPTGYDVQENRYWSDLDLKEEPPVFERKLNYSEAYAEEPKKKTIKCSPLVKGGIVAGLVVSYSYFFGIPVEKSETLPFPQEVLDGMTIKLDSLKNNPVIYYDPD